MAALLASELGGDETWVEEQVRHYTAVARGYLLTDPASRSQPVAE